MSTHNTAEWSLWWIYDTSCLQALLTDETISNVPVLILGNKIDRPEAISEDALRGMFGLHGHTTGKVMNTCGVKWSLSCFFSICTQPLLCFMTSINSTFVPVLPGCSRTTRQHCTITTVSFTNLVRPDLPAFHHRRKVLLYPLSLWDSWKTLGCLNFSDKSDLPRAGVTV